jgi:hypothetical protein
MAGVYAVVGKLGTGKTKFAVWRGQLAMREGRRVASNVDLDLSKLIPNEPRSYTRVPDKPTAFDLDALGRGSDGKYDEDQFGVLILDELGTWLNARSFQDKDRAQVLDWLIHARKKRWEVYLLVQDVGMIDKQVRTALVEYECVCMRMDKVMIPVFGKIIRDIAMAVMGLKAKRWGYLPRFHLVTARLGNDTKIVAEKWYYRGDDLHAAYDTEQVFSAMYPHGAHCVLPAWDFKRPPTLLERLRAWSAPKPRPAAVLKPKLRPVELAGGLGRDEAWALARRYVQATSSRPAALPSAVRG